jgi:hypothetical protein
MCNQIVASRGRSGKVDEVMPGSLSADAMLSLIVPSGF